MGIHSNYAMMLDANETTEPNIPMKVSSVMAAVRNFRTAFRGIVHVHQVDSINVEPVLLLIPKYPI
jgi:hypothetical protein